MKNWLFALAFIGILIEAGCAWAGCLPGTHPVIGPIRCTPAGCTGTVRCVPRALRTNYDHVEGQLWYWTQEARQLGTLDLRAS